MDSYLILQDLGISLLLGLLVGLQREHAGEGRPGMRTFPLITVFGTVTAVLGTEFGGWIVAAGLLCLVAVSVFPHLITLREKDPDKGTTTDIAVLVMYGVGALLVVFVRVLVEISVVAPKFLYSAGPPLTVLMLFTMIPALAVWYRVRKEPSQMPEQENPTQLKSALLFGGMYALVLLALAWADEYLGKRGLFAVACLSGLTDMITGNRGLRLGSNMGNS